MVARSIGVQKDITGKIMIFCIPQWTLTLDVLMTCIRDNLYKFNHIDELCRMSSTIVIIRDLINSSNAFNEDERALIINTIERQIRNMNKIAGDRDGNLKMIVNTIHEFIIQSRQPRFQDKVERKDALVKIIKIKSYNALSANCSAFIKTKLARNEMRYLKEDHRQNPISILKCRLSTIDWMRASWIKYKPVDFFDHDVGLDLNESDIFERGCDMAYRDVRNELDM